MFKIQYDYNGFFRFIHIKSGKASEWVSYTSVATLTVDGRTFVCGRYFPLAECVYELTKHPTELDHSMQYIERKGDGSQVDHRKECEKLGV